MTVPSASAVSYTMPKASSGEDRSIPAISVSKTSDAGLSRLTTFVDQPRAT